jgi:Cysteine dioxygenase type I
MQRGDPVQTEHSSQLETVRRPSRPDVLPLSQLEALARRIAARRDLWEQRLRHDPGERGFFRLYAMPEVEAWILTWSKAQGIELHDHGESAGAVLVVEGELAESCTDLGTRAPLQRLHWPTGSVHRFGVGHVHDLQHVGPRPATSIHVYSPPLATMTFYDHRPDHFLAARRVETVAPAEAPSLGIAL